MKKSIKKILRDETLTDRANGLTHELQEHGGVRVCACTTAQAQAIDTTHETKVLHVGLDAWLQGATRDEPMNRTVALRCRFESFGLRLSATVTSKFFPLFPSYFFIFRSGSP
jgi:hypothetical protein